MNRDFVIPPLFDRDYYIKDAKLTFIPNVSKEDKEDAIAALAGDVSEMERLLYCLRLNDEELLSLKDQIYDYSSRKNLIDIIGKTKDFTGILSKSFIDARKGNIDMKTNIFTYKNKLYNIDLFLYAFFQTYDLAIWVSSPKLKSILEDKKYLDLGHINEVLSKLRIFDNCPERGEVGYMRFKGLIEIIQHYETSKRTYFAVKAFELLVDPEIESSFLTKILTDLQSCYTKRKSCEKYDKDFLKAIEILTRSCPEHFSTLSKINSMLAYVISKKDY